MSASRIFLYFCLSFIGGIFLSSLLPQFGFFTLRIILCAGLILGILLISVLWSYKRFVITGFCIIFLAAGIYCYQDAGLKITNNELREYNDKESPITLIGTVLAEPDIRENNLNLTIQPEETDGKILVTTSRYPEYQYGDKLKIVGNLKAPQEFPEGKEDKSSSSSFAIAQDFNYKDYLAKDGIYSVMYWPEIKLIGKNQGNLLYAKILIFKNKLRETIRQNLSPPESLILGSIILGDKKNISQEWKDKFNRAGLRHLTAVSGMHVAILTSLLVSLLIGLGLFRQQAFYFAIILITLFIIMTGFQNSAIRAGIMGGLFLTAQHLGRKNVSSRTIVFAATIMLIQNPLLLRLDIGFQLSFLAMLGIIYLSPIFQKYLGNILAMTISAQIFTLPILIYNFGYLSLVAPITNVLIVPFLSFLMGLGFIFALVGTIFQPLGWIISFPAKLLLVYLTKVVDWFSSFSWSTYYLEISWFWLFLLYLILGLITWRLQEGQKLKFLKY